MPRDSTATVQDHRAIHPSGYPHAEPTVDRATALKFWYSFLIRHYWHGPAAGLYGPPRHQAFLERIQARIEEQAQSSGPAPTLEIPEIDGRTVSTDDFQRRFVRPNLPVVLRGLAAGWPATREWSPEFLATRYGDQIVPVRLRGDGAGVEDLRYVEMPLAELVDNIAAGGPFFGGHLENLWNRNPELRDGLDIDAMSRLLCRRRLFLRKRLEKVSALQMFLSGGGTRSGFHCAGGPNLFVMVHGNKEWTMVDPRFSKWMHPITRNDMFYAASPARWFESDDRIAEDGCPLYRYVPKHFARLDPGDVLFVPQWWWHAVETKSPAIGVASRTINRFFLGHRLFSAMWLASPRFLRVTSQVLRTGWGADETSGAKAAFEPDTGEAPPRQSEG